MTTKRARTEGDDHGEKVTEWVDFCNCSAGDVPLSFLIHIAEDLFTPMFLKFHEQISSGAMDIEYKGPADLVTEADKSIENQIMAAIKQRYPSHAFLAEESAVEDQRLTDAPTWIIDPIDGTTNFVHGLPSVALCLAFARAGDIKMSIVCCPIMGEMGIAVKGKGAWLKTTRWNKTTLTRMQVSRTQELGKALVGYGFSGAHVAMLRPGAPAMSENAKKRYAQEADDVQHNITNIFRSVRDIRRNGSAAVDLLMVAQGRLDCYHEFVIKEWDIAAGILLVTEAGGVVTDVDGINPVKLHGRRVLAASTPALAKAFGNLLQAKHSDMPAN